MFLVAAMHQRLGFNFTILYVERKLKKPGLFVKVLNIVFIWETIQLLVNFADIDENRGKSTLLYQYWEELENANIFILMFFYLWVFNVLMSGMLLGVLFMTYATAPS